MNNTTNPDTLVAVNFRLASQVVSVAPLAWLKLLHLMYLQKQTVAFTGVRRSPHDLLYLEDVELPRQRCYGSAVQFEEPSADEQDIARVPGDLDCRVVVLAGSPSLRTTDAFSFGQRRGWDWWVVVHVSRNARPTGWLVYNSGPQAKVEVPVHVDWRRLPRDLLDCEGHLDLMLGHWMDESRRIVR